jgi:hypothetical protein
LSIPGVEKWREEGREGGAVGECNANKSDKIKHAVAKIDESEKVREGNRESERHDMERYR